MEKPRRAPGDVPGKKWWMRNGANALFGPVPLGTLAAWAREGRIGPGSEISPDRKAWQRAESRPELRMDWVAGLSPGRFYGPIHADAAGELLQTGGLPGEAVFYRRAELGPPPGLTPEEAAALRGELARAEEGKRRAEELLEAERAGRTADAARWRAESGRLEDRADAAEDRADAAEAEAAALRGKLARAEEGKGRAEALLEAERAGRTADAARWRAESGRLEDRAGAAEAEAAALRGKLARAEEEAAERAEADGRRIRAAAARLKSLAAREADAKRRVKELEKERATEEKRRARGPGAAGRPVVLDAEIVSVEMDAESPAGPAPGTPEAPGARAASGGTGAPFGKTDAAALAALERQLQWELSRLGGRPD